MARGANVAPVDVPVVLAFPVHMVGGRLLAAAPTPGINVHAGPGLACSSGLDEEEVRGLEVIQVELTKHLRRLKAPTVRLMVIDHVAVRPRPRVARPP